MPEQVVIRRATEADGDELARLRWDFTNDETVTGVPPDPEFLSTFRRFWSAATASGEWTVWVAERGERLIGNVWVQRIAKVPRPRYAFSRYGYVTNVYIEEAHRNGGIGSSLLRRAVEQAREDGFEFLIVWPSEESVPFYRRIGFSPSQEAMELQLAES